MSNPCVIRADWDVDARVWVATSDDVPGLVTEAETVEVLDAKLKRVVPELLMANGRMPADGRVAIELLARRVGIVSFSGLPHEKARRRKIGMLRGRINVPDDFDDPLPDDVLREFENEENEARQPKKAMTVPPR